MKAKEFLELLHGNDPINFRLIKYKQAAVSLRGKYEGNIVDTLTQRNKEGYDCYFVVNGGGTHANEINKINAVFIDFDCGRDENKKYFPLEITKQYKNKCIQKVDKFNYQPSFIVETRNGLHIYWLLNKDATVDEFLECQLKLINYFDSDKAVKTSERIMRLPDYYWTKDINNKFMSSILKSSYVRYDIADIITALPQVESEDKRPTNKNNKNNNVLISGTNIDSSNMEVIKNMDIQQLQKIINPKPVKLASYEEVYDYLKRQDLQLFLGLPKRFNCIFHDDNNPSANIFQHSQTGYYWYKCFSNECDAVKDTISITESLLKCNTPKALNFLRKVYQIDFEETDWQREMKAISEENARLLMDNERFSTIAPETYKRIRSYIPNLILISNFAKGKIFTENFTDSKGLPLFFASLKYLRYLCGRNDLKQICNEISLLCYLGLINKLAEEDIPKFLLKEAKR